MNTPALGLEVGPTTLPLGTKVGAWRVSGFRGRGTYGAVYSVVSQEREPPVLAALKLAVYAGDPRFEREVELLSRIRHPSVPRLLDSGLWRHPLGRVYPFVVMEWVQGEPLYAWAARRNPTSRQVLALLAQAAGALQATHEVSGLHRDVKGDNVLVRPEDGRLFLTDFGSGHFAGAARLTPLPMLPGTPAYRSPEMWQYIQRAGLDATWPLMSRPWDDVFALGVMAYRLVTDRYPPSTHPYEEESRCWQPGGGGPVPPRKLNPRVDAQLNALILRMLSPRPEERGTAGELAEAMERGVAHAQAEQRQVQAHVGVPGKQREPRRWPTWLAAVLALGLWPEPTASVRNGKATTAGPISLGDSVPVSSDVPEKTSIQEGIAQQLPRDPLPGQLKPDPRGRCIKGLIAINGGCWVKTDVDPERCIGNGYVYQGSCYVPFYGPKSEPASAPQESKP